MVFIQTLPKFLIFIRQAELRTYLNKTIKEIIPQIILLLTFKNVIFVLLIAFCYDV